MPALLAAIALALGACATRAAAPPPTHPANAAAPIGRLAGPPASLRAGVVHYADVPAVRPAPPQGHSGHEHHKHAP